MNPRITALWFMASKVKAQSKAGLTINWTMISAPIVPATTAATMRPGRRTGIASIVPGRSSSVWAAPIRVMTPRG